MEEEFKERYSDSWRVTPEEAVDNLMKAITYQALRDLLDGISSDSQRDIVDAMQWFKLKRDSGEDIFPKAKILYNSYRGVYKFMIQHILHLPEKWKQGSVSKKESTHWNELCFECPICLTTGEHSEVIPIYYKKTKMFPHRYAHRCTVCGFVCTPSVYESNEEKYVKLKKRNIVEYELPFWAENLIRLEKDHIMEDDSKSVLERSIESAQLEVDMRKELKGWLDANEG